jgi:hypothetical protein
MMTRSPVVAASRAHLARVHAELQAENARLRGQLETVMTALTPIEVGVRLIREKFERRVQGGEQS